MLNTILIPCIQYWFIDIRALSSTAMMYGDIHSDDRFMSFYAASDNWSSYTWSSQHIKKVGVLIDLIGFSCVGSLFTKLGTFHLITKPMSTKTNLTSNSCAPWFGMLQEAFLSRPFRVSFHIQPAVWYTPSAWSNQFACSTRPVDWLFCCEKRMCNIEFVYRFKWQDIQFVY